jgi:membrane protein implicated in regulation of membrane protease activity
VTVRSSLIQFHRVLITAGIVFCAGFAVWAFVYAPRSGRGAFWVLGAVFAILAAALTVYLWNLRRVLGYREDRSSRR